LAVIRLSPLKGKRCGVINTSEEGDDNGGPVVPKVILYSGHPPNTKGFSTHCAMNIGLTHKRKHREDPKRNGDLEEDLFVLSIIWVVVAERVDSWTNSSAGFLGLTPEGVVE
jgi:hypothetical protein